MVQIRNMTENLSKEYVHLEADKGEIDFITAKQMAKDKAFEHCDHPMILSWKNGKTGQTHPDYECGANERPFWIRYAEGRGANLTIDINKGEYIFMVLKI